MIIGIAYDKREDYSFNSDASYFDFTTAAELSYVKQTLEKCGHTVKLLGNYYDILKAVACEMLNDIDLVFNMSEGLKSRNREGTVPILLEMAKIPYTGTDAYGLGLCLNKYHSKIIADYLGIQTPEYFMVNSKDDIVKKEPAFTVSLIGTGADTTTIGIVETLRKNGMPIGIFSSKDKMYGNCKRALVQNMSEQTKDLALDQAIRFHNFAECRDLNRIDYRMDSNGNLFFLEANPLPGLSNSSAFPNCCILNGIPFEDAMKKVIESALKRYA